MDFGDLGDVTFEVEFKGDGCDELYKAMTNIKCENKYRKSDFKVIINPPAVILFKNGKKYVAKAQDEPFDAERGLAIALLRSFGIGYSDLQKMLREANRKNIRAYPVPDTFEPLIFDKPKPKRGRPRKIVKDETPKQKRAVGRPRKVKQDTAKVKRPVGRPRKFRKGDIIAIKEQRTYKYAKINNRANNRLFRDIYEVTAVDDYNNGVFVNGLGWFLPSEVELIEKAK